MERAKGNIQTIMLSVVLLTISAFASLFSFSFDFWCVYGCINIIILLILLVRFQDKMLTENNLYFLSFCLFQFGLPILRATIPGYTNYFLTMFSDAILIRAARFSILAIDITAIGLMSGIASKNKGKIAKKNSWGKIFENNRGSVASAGFILFVFTALVVIPVTGTAAIRQLTTSGFNIASRNVMAQNGFLKFCQEFFYSSALLVLVFDENIARKQIVKACYIVAAVIMLLLADRAQGLVALVVLVFFRTQGDKQYKGARKIFSNIKLVLFGLFSIIILVFIASARKGNSTSGSSIFDFLISFVAELGFNFTSICFVMELIPSTFGYRCGLTYLGAVVKLLPSSLDVFGILNNEIFQSGEMWLYNYNHENRSYLDFGVGFSLNAEAYMNFSWLGLMLLFLLAHIIGKYLKEDNVLLWRKYICYVLLLDLLLLPRRQFFTLVKALEYSVFFCGLYLIFFIKLCRKKKGNDIYESYS